MSTHAANSLISDLAEMVKAVEELPQVQAALSEAESNIAHKDNLVAQLDERINGLNAQIAALQASLAQAEANRDDAELRFLEIEDRFSKLASAVTGAHSLVAVANAVAEPQLTQEQVNALVVDPTTPDGSMTMSPSEAWSQSATDPTVKAATPATEPPSVISSNADNSANAQSTEQGESATDPIPTGTTTNTPASEGVSVSTDPTNANASAPDISSGAAAEPSAASTQAEWPQPSEASPIPLQSSPVPILSTIPEVAASANGSANPSADAGGVQALPYEGKAYSEAVSYPGAYISLNTWLKGGGTHDNYYR